MFGGNGRKRAETQGKLKENEEQWKKNEEQDEEENNTEIRKTRQVEG